MQAPRPFIEAQFI